MASDDDGWLEPGDEMGLWEYQMNSLTVGGLRRALAGLPEDLPVEVEFYDGAAAEDSGRCTLTSKGDAGKPSAVVVTVY